MFQRSGSFQSAFISTMTIGFVCSRTSVCESVFTCDFRFHLTNNLSIHLTSAFCNAYVSAVQEDSTPRHLDMAVKVLCTVVRNTRSIPWASIPNEVSHFLLWKHRKFLNLKPSYLEYWSFCNCFLFLLKN